MTNKDKTKQKLVNSMRKTKAGIASQADAPEQTDVAAKVQTSEPKKPVASSAKPASPAPSKPTTGGGFGFDPYQSSSGNRVWPD